MTYEEIVEARSKRDKRSKGKAREGVPKPIPKPAAAEIAKPNWSHEAERKNAEVERRHTPYPRLPSLA